VAFFAAGQMMTKRLLPLRHRRRLLLGGAGEVQAGTSFPILAAGWSSFSTGAATAFFFPFA
jgi:hypothetical protein